MSIFPKKSTIVRSLAIFALVAFIFSAIYSELALPPKEFPVGESVSIERGQTLFSVSQELKELSVIRSPRVFEMLMLVLGSDRAVSEGDYLFEKPATVIEVALRISGREFGSARRNVTFPEGFTVQEMSDRLKAVFPQFDQEEFLFLAKVHEGYLFPDTYGFFASTKPSAIVAALRKEFEEKINPLDQEIAQSGRSQKDIITMASILEKEANGAEDRAVIAGILWKRLDTGMPLQVDAPFLYLLGKESAELTRSDLQMKSEYNTYINKGLTPTPINNPGIAAITAALRPVQSPYLYYLHDADGSIHYGRTFAEHQQNIKQYLR